VGIAANVIEDTQSRSLASNRQFDQTHPVNESAKIPVPPEGFAVGTESSKTIAAKYQNGFVSRYLSGANILDIGYRGYLRQAIPIVPQAIGIDLEYPGYDGKTLPFADNTQDAVYSSHCLEHIDDYVSVLREWHRVLRIGGFMIISVPHQFLYEKKFAPPSRWNWDHKRFYTPASLMAEVEEALAPNTYRLRQLIDNDQHFTYGIPPEHHSGGSYEIEMVLEKIREPTWKIIPELVNVDIGPKSGRITWIGFGPYESGLRWSDGTLAAIQFPLTDTDVKAMKSAYSRVSITIDTFGKQRISMSLNSTLVCKKTFNGWGLVLDIPTSNLQSGLNTLEFLLPDATRAASDSDLRRPGIAVRNVQLLRFPGRDRFLLREKFRKTVARLFKRP
jgi:SAM-dependent methyltransferase